MNREDIITWAREAGATEWCPGWHLWTDELERFAAIVAEREREACARIVDELPLPGRREELAAAIRARGEAK